MSDNLEWQTEESDEWEELDYEEDYDMEESSNPTVQELEKEKNVLQEELKKKHIQQILNKIHQRFNITHTLEELSEMNLSVEELYKTYEELHRSLWDTQYLLQHSSAIREQLSAFVKREGKLSSKAIKTFADNLIEWYNASLDLAILNDKLGKYFISLLPLIEKSIEVSKEDVHTKFLVAIKDNISKYLNEIDYTRKEDYYKYYDKYKYGEYYTPKYYKHKLKEEDKMVSYEELSDELSEYDKYLILKEQYKIEMAKSGKQLPFESPDKQPYENISLAEQLARKHSFDEVLRGGSLDKENREQLQKSNEKDAKFQLLGDVYSLHTEQIREIGSKLAQETEEASIHSEEPLSELGKLAKKFIEKEGKREY